MAHLHACAPPILVFACLITVLAYHIVRRLPIWKVTAPAKHIFPADPALEKQEKQDGESGIASQGHSRPMQPDWEVVDFSTTKPVPPEADWKRLEPKPYRPWNNGPHHVTMGKRQQAIANSFLTDNRNV